jgi:hypothetical protein
LHNINLCYAFKVITYGENYGIIKFSLFFNIYSNYLLVINYSVQQGTYARGASFTSEDPVPQTLRAGQSTSSGAPRILAKSMLHQNFACLLLITLS